MSGSPQDREWTVDSPRLSQKESAPLVNMESNRNSSSVVLPPIATMPVRLSLNRKMSSSHPSNVSLSGTLQSVILRSAQNSQASSRTGSRRSSNSDINANKGIIGTTASRRTSNLFGDNSEVMNPTLLVLSNSAADLSSLSALQGILETELLEDSARQVRKNDCFP